MSENNKWPYNTRQWRKLRKLRLNDSPLCAYCLEMHRVTPAVIADHIKPVRTHPELAFVFENVQSLCFDCHNSVKAKEERTGKRIGCDVNGLPLDGWK